MDKGTPWSSGYWRSLQCWRAERSCSEIMKPAYASCKNPARDYPQLPQLSHLSSSTPRERALVLCGAASINIVWNIFIASITNIHIYPYSMFVSSAAISRVKFNTRMWVHCPNGALTPLTRFTRRRHRKSTLVNAWICLLEKFLFFLAIALFALGFILCYCIAPFCFFLFFFTVLRLSELLFSGTLQGILWFIFCDL